MLRPSKKLALALEAVVDIAFHGGSEPVQSQDIARRLESLHDGSRVVFFDMPRIDISSSSIRRRVADGRPVRRPRR